MWIFKLGAAPDIQFMNGEAGIASLPLGLAPFQDIGASGVLGAREKRLLTMSGNRLLRRQCEPSRDRG